MNNKNIEIPAAIIYDLPQIEFAGNKEVAIEGFLSIVEYDESFIKIKCKKLDLIILGSKLNIQIISPTSIIISGEITSAEFIKKTK